MTKNIQKLIDECSKKGGGTINFPPGVYKTGTLVLKDNVVFVFIKRAVKIIL